jgi:hypothetical protein
MSFGNYCSNCSLKMKKLCVGNSDNKSCSQWLDSNCSCDNCEKNDGCNYKFDDYLTINFCCNKYKSKIVNQEPSSFFGSNSVQSKPVPQHPTVSHQDSDLQDQNPGLVVQNTTPESTNTGIGTGFFSSQPVDESGIPLSVLPPSYIKNEDTQPSPLSLPIPQPPSDLGLVNESGIPLSVLPPLHFLPNLDPLDENEDTESINDPDPDFSYFSDTSIDPLSYDDPKSDFFSPSSLVNQIIASDFDDAMLYDSESGDMPMPENELDFVINPSFLDAKNLYPRQIEIIMKLFSVYCPYCSNTYFMENEIHVDTPIDNILDACTLYDSKAICPKCRRSKAEAFYEKSLDMPSNVIAVCGQRSGKSTLTAYIAAIILHRFLMIDDISKMYPGVLARSPMRGTFVSLTYEHAYKNVWTPFIDIITHKPWFTQYHSYLKEKSKKLGVKELFKLRDKAVIYTAKNMSFYPSGPDARKSRGDTRIFNSIDELGWFYGDDKSIKYNPDYIFTSLNNSMTTIRSGHRRIFKDKPYAPTAYGVYISSPSTRTDKAFRMYNESKASRNIIGFHYETWNFNPYITKDDLSDEYARNPVDAERDYGANPPYSLNPFINEPATVLPVFGKSKPDFSIRTYTFNQDSLGGTLMSPDKISIRRNHTYPSVLGLDCGFTNNHFGGVLMHKDPEHDHLFKASSVFDMKPDPFPLSYVGIYDNVITEIINNYNIKLVVFDRWESIDLSQRIYNDFGIDAIRYTLSYKEIKNIVKMKLCSNDFILPAFERDVKELLEMSKDYDVLIKDSPVSHLFLQFLLVNDTGRQVIKGDIGTDDIFRAFCLCTVMLYDDKYKDLFTDRGEYVNKIKVKDVIAFAGSITGAGSGINPISSGKYASIGNLGGGGSGLGPGTGTGTGPNQRPSGRRAVMANPNMR